MDLLTLFIKGILVGLAIAVPLGPVGLLCLQRSMEKGRLMGLASGLGAATADALYGLVAAFGLTWVSDFLLDIQIWLALGGGLFLAFLGVRALLSKPVAKSHPEETVARHTRRPIKGLLAGYASTFLFTLTSPVTILAFAAVFAGLGLIKAAGPGQSMAAISLVAGVFSGSAFWWLALSLLGGMFRGLLTPVRLVWVNRGSGVVLIGAAVLVIAGSLLNGS